MLEHIVKKRKLTKERRKKRNKKIKIDKFEFYDVQVNLIEKKEEIFVYSIMMNVYVLLDVSRTIDHHDYIDFEVERLVSENLIVFDKLINLKRFVIVFDFNEKSMITQQNDL